MSEHDTQVLVNTTLAAAKAKELEPEQIYGVIVPEGASHKVIDLEHHLLVPRRARGTVALQTVDDFVRYVQRHDEPATTTLWLDIEELRVTAVLNDHEPTDGSGDDQPAGWGDHRAVLQLKTTTEWDHWIEQNDTWLKQELFAEHVEDGVRDIVEPDGATMLEVAQSIQGSTSATFKNGHRLTNGNIAVEWVEETQATAGRGTLEVPEHFTLGLPPFLGEEAYRVGARFRYRVQSGNLSLKYVLDRPELVLRDAINGIADALSETHGFGRERVFVGKPR